MPILAIVVTKQKKKSSIFVTLKIRKMVRIYVLKRKTKTVG